MDYTVSIHFLFNNYIFKIYSIKAEVSTVQGQLTIFSRGRYILRVAPKLCFPLAKKYPPPIEFWKGILGILILKPLRRNMFYSLGDFIHLCNSHIAIASQTAVDRISWFFFEETPQENRLKMIRFFFLIWFFSKVFLWILTGNTEHFS